MVSRSTIRPDGPVALLRDALARVVRASEALKDGESELVHGILDDLVVDLWRAIEVLEREAV